MDEMDEHDDDDASGDGDAALSASNDGGPNSGASVVDTAAVSPVARDDNEDEDEDGDMWRPVKL
jgi:hypothetical protein